MIVVVEGPSASGKSSWVATHGSGNVIEETGPIELPEDLSGDRLAAIWGERNCRRWAEVIEAETNRGIVLCDTDPLKLHYDYCRARIGATPWDDFDRGVAVAIDAIRQQRLGIADIVLINIPDDERLERQRDADRSRRPRSLSSLDEPAPTSHRQRITTPTHNNDTDG